MTDDPPERHGQVAGVPRQPSKQAAEERLKRALRENLKRRKIQARAREIDPVRSSAAASSSTAATAALQPDPAIGADDDQVPPGRSAG
jgi:hypothetical protein